MHTSAGVFLISVLAFSTSVQGQLTVTVYDVEYDHATIQWTPTSIPPALFAKYEVTRYKGCGGAAQVDKTYEIANRNITSLSDGILQADQQYAYQVAAFRTGQTVPDETSSQVCARTPPTPYFISWRWPLVIIGAICAGIGLFGTFFVRRSMKFLAIVGAMLVVFGLIMMTI